MGKPNWHYDGVYAFYDMDQDPEDQDELLNPHSWEETYHSVVDETGVLEGFFCFEKTGDGLDIGLGLRPDLTGKGLGMAFLEAGLVFAREKFRPSFFQLEVATFNQRAIRVYEKGGFTPTEVFMNETNGGLYEFVRMVRPA